MTTLGQACLALRYLYYIEGISFVPDHMYDKLEKLAIERGDTRLEENVGSDREESYHGTIVSLAELFLDAGSEQIINAFEKNENIILRQKKAYEPPIQLK